MITNLNELYLMVNKNYSSSIFKFLFLNKKPQQKNTYTYYISNAGSNTIIIISKGIYILLCNHKGVVDFDGGVIYATTIQKLILKDRNNKYRIILN